MIRVLFDVNIVLDILLQRTPHAENSAGVWKEIETGAVEGWLSAHAVTTIHYLLARRSGALKAKQVIISLLSVFKVAAVDDGVIREALLLAGNDFEDGVTAAAARQARCHYIVTRDPKSFRDSTVEALPPERLLPLLRVH
jgi:predicted nucleic acid-binding protein